MKTETIRQRSEGEGRRDLPPGFKFCICGMATREAKCRCGRSMTQAEASTPPEATKPIVQPPKGHSEPSKTELAYRREVLDRQMATGILTSIAYEGLTVRLANGHRYTPDWVCLTADGKTVCIEVKGTYRLGSYHRARMAFDQASIEYPTWRWIWSERQKTGEWRTIEKLSKTQGTSQAGGGETLAQTTHNKTTD